MKIILIGTIAGVIAGLGMGGGSILILLLSNFANVSQHVAQATNLVFFIPTAIVASIINFKEKKLDFKLSSIIIFCGVIGSIIGAKLAMLVDAKNLRKYFGIFLIIIAIYETWDVISGYIIKKKKT